ncbi:MAG: hypothetical protein OEV48_09400 [Acidobacteriota bacterium]|jgi:hypothetical protein|nr:hypothetical protein [Acidobacteriota bacterium]
MRFGEPVAERSYHMGMTHEQGEYLGHGVYVIPGLGSELTVSSRRLDLGWREARGQVPGTAVVWREGSFEVVARSEVGRGDRWTLRGWDEASAMRVVFTLTRESIREIADQAASETRGARTRKSTVLLLPLLGLAPSELQKRWADGWGLNAERATQISAVSESLVGSLGIIQVAASAFGGETFMPIWLAYLGVFLFASGFARLALVAADGEPVGSVLGLALLPLTSKRIPATPENAPSVRLFDPVAEALVLESPVHRRDWDRDGVLPFRGSIFRLDRAEHQGRTWAYFFVRVDPGDGEDRALRLAPPPTPRPPPPAADSAPSSFLRTMLVSAAVTLGSASDQKRWAAELGVRAVLLTVVGAGAELVGGIANLQRDFGSAHQLLALLDFFLVGEGLLRLGSAFIGRPMGSVFGWILRPFYRSSLPPAQ